MGLPTYTTFHGLPLNLREDIKKIIMKINKDLLEQFRKTDSKILAVTKYFDKDKSEEILHELQDNYDDIFFGIWENRLNSLREKLLPREQTHFIWNLQTKEIKHIIDFCSTIHSLDSLKKARKINDICENKNTWIKVFIQINLDKNKPGGISGEDLWNFLRELDKLENIWVLWISWMGKRKFTHEEKEKEFDYLISLRNKYIQNWLISDWTSVDCEIALDKWIDIIRVGNKLFN